MRDALLLAIVALACAQGCRRSEPLSPPRVRWGEDMCASCGMSLSDPRFAGAAVWRTSPNGRVEHALFDDVGEMLAWTAPAALDLRWYAGDYCSGKWIDATRACFVRRSGLRSPMATGFAAFAARDDALAEKTKNGGDLFDFEAARKAAASKPYLR